MIDLSYAKKAFEAYLDTFDRSQPRIRLKEVHTYGVVHYSRLICERMGLSDEETSLAELIALLHDIGRFEQVKRFDSFEPVTMDHAAFGCELLFGEEKRIRDFVLDDTYDAVIYTAINEHSRYALPEITDERTLLHAEIIRDADKLDNCRVKLEDDLSILLGMEKEEVGRQPITDQVWKYCLDRKSVVSADRVTRMDYWVSYIAYFFDISFRESKNIILENDFVSRIIARIPYDNPDTAEKMSILEQIVTDYLKERINEDY